MHECEFKLALDDRPSRHQRVKERDIGLLVLSVGRCGGTTQHEYKPGDGKAHATLLRLGCLASTSLSHDATFGCFLVKVVNELVGAWLEGWHFELQGFAARDDLFDAERGHFKFRIILVLVGNDQDKRCVGLDAEFCWIKALLVQHERELWRGICGSREHCAESERQHCTTE